MNDDLADQLERLHADAFGWALHCCGGDCPRAEDVLQIAYLKVAEGRAVPAGRSSFKTWWFGVIRFTAREEFRRQRSREALSLRFWHGLPSVESAPATPPIQVELDEQATRLREALRQLPARQAEVLHLVFYQDLSLSAVASVLGISLGSVRQHYDRGKTRLRSLLSPASDSHERS
jgi:RNA polymerase sigma-70 factor (ECF subfamily)